MLAVLRVRATARGAGCGRSGFVGTRRGSSASRRSPASGRPTRPPRPPGLWRRFQDDARRPHPGRGGRATCAVYSDYQDAGDGDRRFSCLVGAEVAEAAAAGGHGRGRVPAGDYLVFAARGSMPAALATTWERITEFFEHALTSRAFTADLEVHYPAGSAVDVFVAIDG